MSLKLYGFMVSQPTRAAAWLLKCKGVGYEFVPVAPAKGDTKTPEFLKMNPNGLVPVLKDGDFTIFEGNAILTYLAEKHQWTDVYPTDLQTRAKIHQYLHWHHTNTRLSTTQVLRPMVAKARGVATPEQLTQLEQKDMIISRYMAILEQFFVKPFVAETQQPTIADFACYCELDQLETFELFDFKKFPKTSDWIARMKELPHHDEVRKDLYAFHKALTTPAP